MKRVRSAVLRLYPNKEQEKLFELFLQATAETFNYLNSLCRDLDKTGAKLPGKYDLAKMANTHQKELDWMKPVATRCITEAAFRLKLAFDSYYRRRKSGKKAGYPRYKSDNRVDSFQYGNPEGFRFSTECDNLEPNRYLRLGNIGFVKCKNTVPDFVQMKTATVYRRKEGTYYNWYVNIVYEQDDYSAGTIFLDDAPISSVGIDMGLGTRLALSDGGIVPNDHDYALNEKKLAKEQSKLSKLKKGTPEFEKVTAHLAHSYKRQRNVRKNRNLELAIDLTNTYSLIVMEDLDVFAMIQKSNTKVRRKEYVDAAWSTFRHYLKYKAEETGTKLVFVNAAYTSQTCAKCGRIVEKDQSVRIHDCPYCGYVEDRDINASQNILQLGWELLTKDSIQNGNELALQSAVTAGINPQK